jgi:hypothetical protein
LLQNENPPRISPGGPIPFAPSPPPVHPWQGRFVANDTLLSILFLGPEIIRVHQGGTSFTIRNPWVVAFAFGLLHGFGFATAMSAAGLPPTDVPLALVSFNIGVEPGQLAFVAMVLLLVRGFQHFEIRLPRTAELLPAYVVGTFGAFWLVQRLTIM